MTRRLPSRVAVLLLAAPAVAHQIDAGPAHDGCAQYLGNEGILVRHDDTSVLFDAFYNKNFGQYALVPDAMADAIVRGVPPYDDIDALFVSHVHGDHFSPAPTLRFLRAQPKVRLYGSSQVAEALKRAGAGDDVLERVIVFDLEPHDDARSVTIEGIEISVAAIPHSGGQRMADIRNLSFRVQLDNGPAVVHMGDAGAVHGDFARHTSHWLDVKLDASFPPYWLLQTAAGKRIVDEFLDAGQVIGVHVPASARGKGDAARRQIGFDVFTDPGETRALGHETTQDCAPGHPEPAPSATMGN